MTTTASAIDVAVVGGGPAGAAVAARLARLGHHVVIFERTARWRWRAGGVFSSPATVTELAELGLDGPTITHVARPIPAMRVETPRGTAFRLTYGADRPGASTAVGFDRCALDGELLALAAAAGATVDRGTEVHGVTFDPRGAARLTLRDAAGARDVDARVVVGADGPKSIVARDAGVTRRPPFGIRIGLTWHVAESGVGSRSSDAAPEARPDAAPDARPDAAPEARPDAARDSARDARMVILPDGAYCGLAPVPGGRVNVGIVLWGREHRARLASGGAAAAGRNVLASIARGDDAAAVASADPDALALDAIAGASPLGARVARRAGRGWLLVGDAAGFLDPFTGEGLHRALVSARLAAEVIDRALRMPSSASALAPDLAAYERAMRARFGSKDVVSWLVQAFVARPWLFEHIAGRLAARERIRGTMGLVMGDLVPASRALDPRFVAGLLAP